MTSSTKVLLLGAASTGKSAFARRVIGGEAFSTDYAPTLGVEVHPLIRGARRCNLWDVAGNPAFAGMSSGYFVGAKVALLFFYLADIHSIREAERYLREVLEMEPDAKFVLVASKCDLEQDEGSACREALASLVDASPDATKYFPISTRVGLNMDALVEHIMNL